MTADFDLVGSGSPARSAREDLVVATQHQGLVQHELGRFGLSPRSVEPDDNLRLTLLRGVLTAEDGMFSSVDELLTVLRMRFRGRFGGWTPEMGKNREVASVVTEPGGGPGKTHFFAAGNPAPAAPTVAADGPAGVAPTAGTGVRIGMVDGPVDGDSPVSQHVVQHGTPALDRDTTLLFRSWDGHSTLIADLLLAGAPAARPELRAVTLDAAGGTTAWEAAKAMAAFAGTGIDILNLSVGCATVDGQPPFVIARAIELLTPQVLVIAAAGNHGNDTPWLRSAPIWPAALPDVVAVGATDAAYSPDLPWVACTATGTVVSGAYLTGLVRLLPDADHPDGPVQEFHGFASWQGTSFAAARVSAAIAAAMQPGQTAREALDTLLAAPAGNVRPYLYEPPADA
jgi:membrane-anchored mycosin MYCP